MDQVVVVVAAAVVVGCHIDAVPVCVKRLLGRKALGATRHRQDDLDNKDNPWNGTHSRNKIEIRQQLCQGGTDCNRLLFVGFGY